MLRSFFLLLFGLSAAPLNAGDGGPPPIEVGVAAADITPNYPVRLSGFGFRREESEGVTERIWAKALAIGSDEQGPAVVLAVDNLGLPDAMVEELAGRLKRRHGIARERLAVTFTHTHTAPMLRGVAPTLFGQPIPPEHQQHIDRYTDELTDHLEQVALAALADRKPARLSWGMGHFALAKNRRTEGGPVDHDLPLLAMSDLDGKLRAVWISYACHCVTLSNNRISGDWAGYAQKAIEKNHPGTVALVSIGCGADSNPQSGVTGDKVAIAAGQGDELAAEVGRVLAGKLTPLTEPLTCRFERFDLPLAGARPRAEWLERVKQGGYVGYHAQTQLDRLDRGEKLKDHIAYSVETWHCGDQLAIVFLPGEVVVDYSLRLKRELDRSRLWVNAYSNDDPCYIPSERVLKEGGYEGGDAMTYYNVPTRLAAGLEKTIVAAVHRQLPASFQRSSAAEAAKKILDDARPGDDREALVGANLDRAGELTTALAEGLDTADDEEQYRRIPWIWQVAIAAARRADRAELKPLVSASLPSEGQPLADWQAVVIGGGVINGLSQAGRWPGDFLREMIKDDQPLAARLSRATELAAAMADNPNVRNGTRYDALRMIALDGWDRRGAQLKGYLAQGIDDELQMGAISGLSDVRSPQVGPALAAGLSYYSPGNRELALDALVRDESRVAGLLDALASKAITPAILGETRIGKLRELADPQLRQRAERLLGL